MILTVSDQGLRVNDVENTGYSQGLRQEQQRA